MIFVEYSTDVVYRPQPVVMAGVFEDLGEFRKFAETEVRREVYRKTPFSVLRTKELSAAEAAACFQKYNR